MIVNRVASWVESCGLTGTWVYVQHVSWLMMCWCGVWRQWRWRRWGHEGSWWRTTTKDKTQVLIEGLEKSSDQLQCLTPWDINWLEDTKERIVLLTWLRTDRICVLDIEDAYGVNYLGPGGLAVETQNHPAMVSRVWSQTSMAQFWRESKVSRGAIMKVVSRQNNFMKWVWLFGHWDESWSIFPLPEWIISLYLWVY